jgi:hypothetical protein
MLRFQVFHDGQAAPSLDLDTLYLLGADNVPVRSEFTFAPGELSCRKRPAGPCALALMWPVSDFGAVLLETVRLPERPEPYVLNVELARGRMMRLLQKREEWGLLDISAAQKISDKFNEGRDLLIAAIENLDDPAAASRLADRCLAATLPLSEQTAVLHAELLLQRRINTRSIPKNVFGCWAELQQTGEPYRRKVLGSGDFVCLPMPWKLIEPQQQTRDFTLLDDWINLLLRAKIPVVAGPLVQFHETVLPGWLYIWENDYETVRGLLYEHIERLLTHFGGQVALWNVLSGLHANAHFVFTYDQLMDLTRMAVTLVKKKQPTIRTMIEITQPWGEYYAANSRSIPPLVYAEMAVQSGVPFDVFGLQLCFGAPHDGCWQRDLFQISAMLDHFAPFGKPVIITRLAVPNTPPENGRGGVWHKPWSDSLQARWLETVTNIALSKPFVEAVCWSDLVDRPGAGIPAAGLLGADLNPKAAFQTWQAMRRAVATVHQNSSRTGGHAKPGAGATAEAGNRPQ